MINSFEDVQDFTKKVPKLPLREEMEDNEAELRTLQTGDGGGERNEIKQCGELFVF